MSNEAKWAIGLGACVLVLCLCFTVFCIVGGGLSLLMIQNSETSEEPAFEWNFEATIESLDPDNLDNPEAPTRRAPTAKPTPRAMETQQPADAGAVENLERLEAVIVPLNDPHDLAFRLEGKVNVPKTVEGPSEPLKVGAKETFWALNDDTRNQFQVEATLKYVTDHLYFFIEDGVRFDQGDLKRLCETFETQIYPTNREFFGSEWTPGVDNDPHLYVLYARGLGSNIAGYYSPMDEFHPDVHEYSNAHEMFFMSADNVSLGEEYIYGTMAHEFQHMIHWYRDGNETSWINEGFSVLAELLNDYDIGGFDYYYVSQPDIQLTYWPSTDESAAHYGQSFLFVSYFLDRFGEEATQAVVAHEGNSMDSIEAVLKDLNITDAVTGKEISADDVFADWVITSYLNDRDAGDGRFAYKRYQAAPQAGDTEEIDQCPSDWENRTVRQYGVDYIKINCSGTYTLNFEGATEVGVLPIGPYEGQFAFWSNKGDASNMVMTRAFDFTNVNGPLTITYQMWYDLEEDYDYVYLEASEDGERWEILQTPSGTDEDPVGNSYGWAYNASSGGWVEETVDLSRFAGKKVQLRFEYVTDTAVNGEGFMLDNIAIPQIDYSANFEEDDGGWEGKGFVRIENDLPQAYRVSLILQGDQNNVQYIQLDDSQKTSFELDLSAGQQAILVVSGVTRFTNQEATYRFRVVP